MNASQSLLSFYAIFIDFWCHFAIHLTLFSLFLTFSPFPIFRLLFDNHYPNLHRIWIHLNHCSRSMLFLSISDVILQFIWPFFHFFSLSHHFPFLDCYLTTTILIFIAYECISIIALVRCYFYRFLMSFYNSSDPFFTFSRFLTISHFSIVIWQPLS